MMELVTRLLILGGVGSIIGVLIFLIRSYYSSSEIPRNFDHGDVGADPSRALLVEFTSPYCYSCKVALPVLKAASVVYSSTFALIDAKTRPDLITKYGVRTTPTILVVDQRGSVRAGWQGAPPSDAELSRALAGVSAA